MTRQLSAGCLHVEAPSTCLRSDSHRRELPPRGSLKAFYNCPNTWASFAQVIFVRASDEIQINCVLLHVRKGTEKMSAWYFGISTEIVFYLFQFVLVAVKDWTYSKSTCVFANGAACLLESFSSARNFVTTIWIVAKLEHGIFKQKHKIPLTNLVE